MLTSIVSRQWLLGALTAALVAVAGWVIPFHAQSTEPLIYTDAAAPIERRVSDLVGRMTLQEKVSQLVHDAKAINRLGVPAYNWWNEGLHGVARAGRATVFPQAIGLAAMWDTALMREVATAISDEARAKHHEFVRRGQRGIYEGLTFWSPNINIFRDPRWGRGMETYGEDPYLVGRLAVEFVRGLQGDDPKYLKTVATPKHFAVHSGPESDRHTFDATVDERDLRETYLPQFEMAVREGGALSVMCAYNRYLGVPACASPLLLDQVLRKEWGFAGYVVSDCGAIDDIYQTHKLVKTAAEAAAMGVRGGCDLSCGDTYKSLVESVKLGLITEADIDVAVRRLFTIRFRLGMFDPPASVPYAQIPYATVDSPAHRRLALQAARKSIVLLKNEGQLLPLKAGYKTIAVIGPNADDEEVLLGNYNGTPTSAVTPLQGIRARLGSSARVLFEQGTDWADNLPSFEVIPSSALRTTSGGRTVPGLTGAYFNIRGQSTSASWQSSTLTFPALGDTAVLTRVDPRIDFRWLDRSPDPQLPDDGFAVRWTGELVAPETGTYQLGGVGLSGFRIYLDDELVVEYRGNHESNKKAKAVLLEAGHAYRLRIEYFNRHADARFQLFWSRPVRRLEEKALAAARQADLIVAVMGLSPRLEGEQMDVPVEGFKGGDRVDLGLPNAQDRLLHALAGLGKPLVLVLLNGSALACPWAVEHVPAIVEAWYPGQAAGTALSDVLAGDYNPAGRLPVTVYSSATQLPPFNDYAMKNRTYRYFTGEPLFPFGFGLSYTTFAYRNLVIPAQALAGQPVAVSVDVENTGTRAGEEVVQLYVTDVAATVPVPIRSLQGFERITLKPGEQRTVRFTLAPRQLSLVDKNMQRVIEPGVFEIAVGGKQPGFKGRADAATTQVVTGRFEVTGSTYSVR
ncbi:MAG: glycoside hydrolase family 3 C-terminal domain-containing protein [Acidobacteria bacterium]|nr:glycoside hydrolase family 3 C-terminal domain-containing protein [Acidobacteriota bacterium]